MDDNKNMILKDYKISDILISNDSLHNITRNYEQQFVAETSRDKYKNNCVSSAMCLITSMISIVPTFGALNVVARIITMVMVTALIIYTIISATLWYREFEKAKSGSNSHKSLELLVLDSVQEWMRYTAIVRVTYRHQGEMRYLTGTDHFLPHCSMNPELTIDEQKDNIIQCLHDDFIIQEKDIIAVRPLDRKIHFSIKPIRGKVQMNAYVFYDVEIKIQVKDNLVEQSEKRIWMSLEKMKRTPDVLAVNKDVVDLLSDFPKPKESFVNKLGNLNIIWNITSQCNYNCAICATYDNNREELEADKKLQVLNNIMSAKSSIKNLDFAGGDPFKIDESINIVQSAIGQLGAERVSVTTTGEGALMIASKNNIELIKHCEITIDAAHSNLDESENITYVLSRGEENYCKTNFEQVNLLLDYAESMTINIPIINDDLSEREISNLVSQIVWIKERNPAVEIDALLIRLMPVGKVAINMTKKDYEEYNPIQVARKIKMKIEERGIKCNYHCSFRVLPCFYEESEPLCHCTMLENKIGIDCAGNVFACAWGAYLPCAKTPTQNPFYLGNLTQKSLKSILEGENKTRYYREIFSEIDSGQKRHFCSVVSYYANKKMFENYDYLSKVNKQI